MKGAILALAFCLFGELFIQLFSLNKKICEFILSIRNSSYVCKDFFQTVLQSRRYSHELRWYFWNQILIAYVYGVLHEWNEGSSRGTSVK